MRAKDTSTGLPPNIEGGTPAPGGSLSARVTPDGAHWWVQPYLTFATKQTHLSSLDASDRRTGASRTRAQIQNFFRRGARNRGWISADDTLIQTGETLAQIQDRVLGVGVNSSNLWSAVPAYSLVGVRWACALDRNRLQWMPKTSPTKVIAASAGEWTGRVEASA